MCFAWKHSHLSKFMTIGARWRLVINVWTRVIGGGNRSLGTNPRSLDSGILTILDKNIRGRRSHRKFIRCSTSETVPKYE
ncbi:uncharacterized protein LOC143305350 isoform X3 [Osmia lignaria lignaria]|uniref:uncharacterized protein LOC143305350 isoform X3 n=1 Tax=Osmia lignaria lignaria TaxID=1437193 RepID=UPI00402BA051